MKPLQELKNRLQNFKFYRLQKAQDIQDTKSKTLISKWFSDDEDLWF